jgi:hypothetical protein
MKYTEDEMMKWFQTKEEIKDDWFWKYSEKISNFAVWAERIVYSLFNGKWIWQPNSCPVWSDMFFEVDDAFIHIDLKTVQSRNIWDISTSIFVWTNQNSYKWKMNVRKNWWNIEREYTPALPTFYNKWKENQKICLSYFVTILYEDINYNILNINLICMPNWELEEYYKSRVLKAWKVEEETRFNFSEVNSFELLENTPKRVKVVYFDKNMSEGHKRKLRFYEDIYNNQNN